MLIRILCSLLLALAVTRQGAAEISFGRVHELRGHLPGTVPLPPEADNPLYRDYAQRPYLYRMEVPAGSYQIKVHYLTSNKPGATLWVRHAGQEIIAATPSALMDPKTIGEQVHPAQVSASLTHPGGWLDLEFPSEYLRDYAIQALELIGAPAELRINCGGKEYTDASGRVWQADRTLPRNDGPLRLKLPAVQEGWQALHEAVLGAFREAKIFPIAKWNGLYVRGLGGVVVDHDGATFLAMSGIGLWAWDLTQESLQRVDQGAYAAGLLAKSSNPLRNGFALFSSHGLSPNQYQLFRLDGQRFTSGSGNHDYGAVNWSQQPPQTVLGIYHHRTRIELSRDGGASWKTIPGGHTNLSVVGVFPDDSLIRCYTRNERQPDKPDNPPVGIERSEDYGQTWVQVSQEDTGHACFPLTSLEDQAWLPVRDGLLHTSDAGRTWQRLEGAPVFAHPVLLGASAKDLVGCNPQGVYRSHDGGHTWQRIVDNVPKLPAMLTQDHRFWDFTYDWRRGLLYGYAPDQLYRIQLPQ